MRTHSTFTQIFIAAALIMLTGFISIGVAFGIIAYRTNFETRTEALRTSALEVANITAPMVSGGDLQHVMMLSGYYELASSVSGYHILLCDTSGRVLITPNAGDLDANLLSVGQEVIGSVLLSGEYAGTGNLGGLYTSTYVSVGVPVVSASGATIGAVFVSAEMADVTGMIMRFVRILLSVGLLAVAASCVGIFYSTGRFTRPLRRVAEASREFARGNFTVRVDENSTDADIRELAVSFNNMAASLERSEERRREFIASISHELKTPMTSIGGYVDGILDGVVPADRQEEYLRIVSSETKRLSRLVSQMLEISRVEAAEGGEERMQIFDLCELMRQVLLSQEKKITDRNLDVEVCFDRPVEVVANTDGITRVIYNLLDNAVKYSDEGTTITLDVVERGNKAVASVSNVGRPISPEEREKIFERFHKADSSRKTEGLGLGLYLVKQIMARHNEDVWCETSGARTTMRFTLPLSHVDEKNPSHQTRRDAENMGPEG